MSRTSTTLELPLMRLPSSKSRIALESASPRQEHLHGTDNQLIQLGGRKEHMRRAGGKTRNQTAHQRGDKEGNLLAFQIDQRTAHEKGNDEGYQKILHRAADHKRKAGTAESIAEDARAELEIGA